MSKECLFDFEKALKLPELQDDYLTRAPSQTKEKVLPVDKAKTFTVVDAATKAFQLDVNYPSVPRPEPLLFDRLHDPVRDTPWEPADPQSKLYEAHAMLWLSGPPVDGEEKTPESRPNWKRQEMIKQLTPTRLKHCREWKRKMNASEEHQSRATSKHEVHKSAPDSEHQSPATDEDCNSQSSSGEESHRRRRIWAPKRKSPLSESVKQAQAKMGHLLDMGQSERTADVPPGGFVQRVTEKVPAEDGGFEAGEEYDIAEVEMDELEPIFDQPNISVGAFDKAEVDMYVEQQRQAIAKGFRDQGFDGDAVDQLQREKFGMSLAQLDERGETARRDLVVTGKMQPLKPPPKRKSSPPKKSPPKKGRRQSSSRR